MMNYRKFLACFIFINIFLSTVSFAQSSPEYIALFTLERTLNTNQLVYEVNPKSSDPIHVYWIMHAQDGHYEELTAMERKRAYGTDLIEQNNEFIQFAVRSLPSHPITVHLNGPIPYATIVLSGEDKILHHIFLNVSGGLIPKVRSIDIFYQENLEGPILKAPLPLETF